MFRASSRYLTVLFLSAAWPLAAQVEEVEAPVDLAKGLVLRVDAVKAGAPLAGATQTQVGSKDFALSMMVGMPSAATETLLAGQGDDSQGWRLLATADGALRFEARTKSKPDPFVVATAPGVIAPGSTHHFAINIVRDAAKPNAAIWLDGIELASGIVPPVDLTASQSLSAAAGAAHLHLYQRSLTRPEMLALWLDAADSGEPATRHPSGAAPASGFVPQPNETIALIGGTDAVAFAESGELEAMLLLVYPETRFHFRSLAWEGDTVFRQDRPMNFGDLSQQLRRVNAGAAFVMFGRQECLDRGLEGLEEFKHAFAKLVDVVQKRTPNIVVIGPPPFEYSTSFASLKGLLREKSSTLASYNSAMADICKERHLVFADLKEGNFDSHKPMTRDGVNWTPHGLHMMTRAIADLIGVPFSVQEQVTDKIPAVRAAIEIKNRLWHDYWRPSNWAFLHGDRTQQPSSRDPVNPQLRFFPTEQEKYLPLLKDAEEKIYKIVEDATKKLP